MSNKLFLLLGLFAALATNSLAQNDTSQNPSGPNVSVRLTDLEKDLSRLLDTDDDVANGTSRPRVVVVKAADVKASVIVNTVSLERIAFDMLNQKRAENGGLPPLAWSDALASVARLHSQNMAEFNFFSHRGLDNKMVSDRADDAHVGRWRSIGENIAFNRGYKDPVAKAVELWLDSPSHRRNLLDSNWKESAVGIAVAHDGSYYLTQVFMKK